ncbi:MAG: hypothetical protein CMJ46_01200 [Planctomyces sp.]|nr:hypothetical protein [Planctomyces sp.]
MWSPIEMWVPYFSVYVLDLILMVLTLRAVWRTWQCRKQSGHIIFYINENGGAPIAHHLAIVNLGLIIFSLVVTMAFLVKDASYESSRLSRMPPMTLLVSACWIPTLMMLFQWAYFGKIAITRKGFMRPASLFWGPLFVPWASVVAIEEVRFSPGVFGFRLDEPDRIESGFRLANEDLEFIISQLNALLPEGVHFDPECESAAQLA